MAVFNTQAAFFWLHIFAIACAQLSEQLDDTSYVDGVTTTLTGETRHFYTPSTPSPEDINCYVDVPATRVGGQCVRLGFRRRRGNRGRPQVTWGCQAGVHLSIIPECQNQQGRSRTNTDG